MQTVYAVIANRVGKDIANMIFVGPKAFLSLADAPLASATAQMVENDLYGAHSVFVPTPPPSGTQSHTGS